MTTILTALAVFIFTIVGLVVVLMVARNKLVPSGSVKIFTLPEGCLLYTSPSPRDS